MQLQESKLTTSYFNKNVFSQMSVVLVVQVRLATVPAIIHRVIDADDVKLPS